jgi:hypothetical protein
LDDFLSTFSLDRTSVTLVAVVCFFVVIEMMSDVCEERYLNKILACRASHTPSSALWGIDAFASQYDKMPPKGHGSS